MRLAADPLPLDFGRNKEFCVYVYRDPRPGKKRAAIYVGKGQTKVRPTQHWRTGTSNKEFATTLKEIRDAGLEPIVELVAFFDDERTALATEKVLIGKLKGNGCLCNVVGAVARQFTRCIASGMSQRLVEAIDEWRRQQRDLPNRAEAIRRLVEQSLGLIDEGIGGSDASSE